MLLVQKWPFWQLFFLGNIVQENVFYNILQRKNAFLGCKNKKFKKSKNSHFSKAVNPCFWSKITILANFFLGNIGQENLFYDILEPKNAFLGYKIKKFKKSKNWHFSKGVTHGFGPKLAILATFFFKQYRPGKCLLRYFRTKTAILGYKNNTFKKSKNWHFSKGVNPCFWSKNSHFCNFFF